MSEKIGLTTLMRVSDAEARRLLEGQRWPDGPVCPHCGVVGGATRIEKHKQSARTREGLWQCRACDKQFSVTVGTVMEGSHIPLGKWLAAIHILCSSKKSVSALQLQRQLELGSYKTAWHLAHRVRHMMANIGPQPPLDGIVEADETYIGGKPRPHGGTAPRGKAPPWVARSKRGRGTKKVPVQVLVQRGGAARARVVPNVTGDTLKPFIRAHVAKTAAIHSDEHGGYVGLGREFTGGHHVVNHGKGEYARDGVHSNSCESFNGLFKRSLVGAWHNISREHLGRYLDEACFRWSLRKGTDWQRTVRALKQGEGVRLYYKAPRRQGEDEGQSVLARRLG
jgi:transposase-like protein